MCREVSGHLREGAIERKWCQAEVEEADGSLRVKRDREGDEG